MNFTVLRIDMYTRRRTRERLLGEIRQITLCKIGLKSTVDADFVIHQKSGQFTAYEKVGRI